jgi:hypothetical protein
LLIALNVARLNCFLGKQQLIAGVFNEATNVISLHLNANVGYFAEKWQMGKDQSAKKV